MLDKILESINKIAENENLNKLATALGKDAKNAVTFIVKLLIGVAIAGLVLIIGICVAAYLIGGAEALGTVALFVMGAGMWIGIFAVLKGDKESHKERRERYEHEEKMAKINTKHKK